MPAGDAGEGGRRGEDDPPVGQPARVEVVHVGQFAGDLPQAGAVGADLVDLPRAPVRHGEQQSPPVESEIHLADVEPTLRLEERFQFRPGVLERQDRDPVFVAGPVQAGVALVVGRQPQLPSASLQQDQFVEVDQRIGQQGFAPEPLKLTASRLAG